MVTAIGGILGVQCLRALRRVDKDCVMKKYMIRWLIASLMMGGTAFAQGKEAPYNIQTRQYSRPLGWTGVVTTLAGVAMLGPWGTPVTVLDSTYCVTEYEVSSGGCNARGKQAAIGAALIGGGILMAWTGFRTVTVVVKPQVSKTSKGAAVTLAWGGSHAAR